MRRLGFLAILLLCVLWTLPAQAKPMSHWAIWFKLMTGIDMLGETVAEENSANADSDSIDDDEVCRALVSRYDGSLELVTLRDDFEAEKFAGSVMRVDDELVQLFVRQYRDKRLKMTISALYAKTQAVTEPQVLLRVMPKYAFLDNFAAPNATPEIISALKNKPKTAIQGELPFKMFASSARVIAMVGPFVSVLIYREAKWDENGEEKKALQKAFVTLRLTVANGIVTKSYVQQSDLSAVEVANQLAAGEEIADALADGSNAQPAEDTDDSSDDVSADPALHDDEALATLEKTTFPVIPQGSARLLITPYYWRSYYKRVKGKHLNLLFCQAKGLRAPFTMKGKSRFHAENCAVAEQTPEIYLPHLDQLTLYRHGENCIWLSKYRARLQCDKKKDYLLRSLESLMGIYWLSSDDNIDFSWLIPSEK